MARSLALALCLLLLAALVGCPPQSDSSTPKPDGIDVYFSPNGGCTDAVVRELDAAKQTVHVQAYRFTSAPIAKALVDAHKRGVKVLVILDKSQRTEKYSSADFVAHAGIPVQIDAAPPELPIPIRRILSAVIQWLV